MNPELRAVLTKALGRHEFVPASFIADPKPAHCACGEWCDSGRWQPRVRHNFLEHFAEEIDKALGGLTRRWGVVIEHPPRPADGYPGAVVELDSYKLREATEITKRDQWPDDCYEVRSRWVSGWSEA